MLGFTRSAVLTNSGPGTKYFLIVERSGQLGHNKKVIEIQLDIVVHVVRLDT